MRNVLLRLVVFTASLVCMSSLAFAQGAASTTSLSGIVKDADGGVLPGATVTVTNIATKTSQTAVTNGQGLYSFPNMNVGTYTVTVEMSGFKKMTHTDVRLLGNQPANITTTLQIGGLTEEITVSTPTDLVRVESPTVSSTISGEFIKSVPARSRNALDFLVFLPGVDTQRRERPRLHDQRPAAEHDQHHDRRRQHQQQPAVGRRLLHDGHAATRRGRGSDAHDGDGRRRQLGAGRDAGSIRHQVRHEHLPRHRVRVLPAQARSTRTRSSTG